MRFIAWILIKLIDAYAVTLGPHLGGRCRFEPSCSQYAKQSVDIHGPIKGTGLALWRILRCGPWTRGGFDPVPPKTRS
jgi:putative membrane protein insertion efficiency factor